MRSLLSCLAVTLLAAGCATQQPDAPPTATTTAAAAPKPISHIDPQWMGVTPDQPPGWRELGRTLNTQRQEFNFAPDGETELPTGCNGCVPWTAVLTAYSPGAFDPAPARAGTPVDVLGEGDGFFVPAVDGGNAMLYWPYAGDGWASVEGRSTMTSDLVIMRELAAALRPADRSPARLPLTLSTLPAQLPLAEIDTDELGYGTRVTFDPCGPPNFSYAPDCPVRGDHLKIQIWPRDGYYGFLAEDRSVPIEVDGRPGRYDGTANEAAIQVIPGMLVKFQLDKGGAVRSDYTLTDILAAVKWAPEIADRQNWPAVSDWVQR